jgi:hypothetical protein
MLFTAQRAPNVDIRDWGGTNWWQNLRWVAGPMTLPYQHAV